MQLTTNFNKIEFDSKDGFLMPPNVLENLKVLAKNLQIIRDSINSPIHINSAYRSPEHNARIGGKPNSQHILGKAADITTKKYTSKQLVLILKKMIEKGEISEGGLGLVHYDIRGTKARWNFSTKYKDFF